MPLYKRLLALVITVWLWCGMSVTVFAQALPDMSRTGSVTVTMRQGTTPVSGGTLTLYRVGAVKQENGDCLFVLTGDFVDGGETLDDVSSAELAERLAGFADDHDLDGNVREISEEGEVCFADLELGLYLLVQEQAADGYAAINPFLVSVPLAEEGHYLYDVDASPKVALIHTTLTTQTTSASSGTQPSRADTTGLSGTTTAHDITPEQPSTGESAWPLMALALLSLFAAALMVCCGRKTRAR